MTSSDTATAVRRVARHGHNPPRAHWKVARHTIFYLNNTKIIETVFAMSCGLDIQVYNESNCGSSKDVRRFMTDSTNALREVSGIIDV